MAAEYRWTIAVSPHATTLRVVITGTAPTGWKEVINPVSFVRAKRTMDAMVAERSQALLMQVESRIKRTVD